MTESGKSAIVAIGWLVTFYEYSQQDGFYTPDQCDLSDVLLSLYECLTNADHYEVMVTVLGSWLESDLDPVEGAKFEEHSDAVWQALGTLDDTLETTNGFQPFVTFDKFCKAVDKLEYGKLVGVLECIHSDDLKRLKEWLKQGLSGEPSGTILRYYKDELDVAKIATVVRRPDNSGLFDLFLNDQRLDETVEQLIVKDLNITHSEIQVIRYLVQGYTVRKVAERTHHTK